MSILKNVISALTCVQSFVNNASYKGPTWLNAKPFVPIQRSQTVLISAMISSREFVIAMTPTPLLHCRPNHDTKSCMLLCNPLWIMQGERKQHGQLHNRVRVFGIAKRRMHLKLQCSTSSWQSVIKNMCFCLSCFSFDHCHFTNEDLIFSFSIYFIFIVVSGT
jgi:hypothetical protein